MMIKRAIGLIVGAAALLAVAVPAAAVDPNGASPQAGVKADVDYAPDECLYLSQAHPAEQKYRGVNNAPFTYDQAAYGTDWFDVACGKLTFTVPFGKEALVDLTAVAELDCRGKADANAWCGGRFLVDGSPALPVNTGRTDSYAWDSANGGSYDWQANTLAQEYVVKCHESPNQQQCTYTAQLQSRLENGAASVWIDDLTVRVDVTVAPVTIMTGSTTP